MVRNSITIAVEVCEHCGMTHQRVPMEKAGGTTQDGQRFVIYEGRCPRTNKRLDGLVRIDQEPSYA